MVSSQQTLSGLQLAANRLNYVESVDELFAKAIFAVDVQFGLVMPYTTAQGGNLLDAMTKLDPNGN